jgi:cleavage and polyadenylation specificity factor subunit 1
LEAVPAPVGGVLVFSHNALIHIDQTHTPGFAALVNPFFDLESHFKAIPNDDGTPSAPVKNKPPSVYVKYGKTGDCKSLGISLDGARSTFLSPDLLVFVLRNGDMYRAELVGDEGSGKSWKRKRGGVRDIKIQKLGLNMTPPSVLLTLANMNEFNRPQILGSVFQMDGLKYYSNFFFAGSIVTDALLVQFVEAVEQAEDSVAEEAPADVESDDEMDLELYGGSAVKTRKAAPQWRSANVKFRICDVLLVSGPLRSIALGQPAPYSDEVYYGEPTGSHLEIVGCGGFDTHGSLVVMHKSIRPQIITSFSLGSVEDIWSVAPVKESFDGIPHHRYLLISKPESTTILKTGESIEELENSNFYVDGPTVDVCTLQNNSIIIQIYPEGVLLLTQGHLILI